jgi:hypothetical protein
MLDPVDWVVLIAGAPIAVASAVGVVWLMRRSSIAWMERTKSAMQLADLTPTGVWSRGHGGFVGEVRRDGITLHCIAVEGRGGYLKLRSSLPRTLTFSPLLSPGPISLSGAGGLVISREASIPAEAEQLITPEIRSRFDNHPVWRSPGQISVTADLIEYSGEPQRADDAVGLREVADVIVLVRARALAL